MDISILRKKPQDRLRQIILFDDDTITAEVLFCATAEMKAISDLAKQKILDGMESGDAYNVAYGRIALRSWQGLEDGGEPLPFTLENCDLLMLGSAEFRLAVITAATSLKVGAEKN